MKAEHLKSWLWKAAREKNPDTEVWGKVVGVTQVAFQEGYIPEALMWKTLVLIPKGGGEYIGIGLVDTIWKFCTSIVNSRTQSSIVLHDVLHSFQHERGSVTEIMEAKIEQQLTGIVHEPLFRVSIYVKKAYNSLDRGRCIEILFSVMAWDLSYSGSYSGIGADRWWFQSQGSIMDVPSARVEE